jgi:hypothetical protein
MQVCFPSKFIEVQEEFKDLKVEENHDTFIENMTRIISSRLSIV